MELFSGSKNPDGDLNLGKLLFMENIGQVALMAVVQIKEDISMIRNQQLDSRWSAGRILELSQLTRIRLFPDAGHLAEAACGRHQFRIPNSILGKRAVSQPVSRLFDPHVINL